MLLINFDIEGDLASRLINKMTRLPEMKFCESDGVSALQTAFTTSR